MKKTLLSLLLTLPLAAQAVLSPLNQSALEIETILKSTELQNLLPQSSMIYSIEKQEDGYLIHTQGIELEVKVIKKSAQRPGSQPFELKFGKPIPL